jgi:protein ImuA
MEAAARPFKPTPERAPGGQDGGFIASLRRTILSLEGRPAVLADDPAAFSPFGVPAVDAALGGGLRRGVLHEIAATGEAEIASATGFTLTLAARAPARAVLWIAEQTAMRESGAPYGLGLDEIGLAPERLVIVTAAHARDVLWAMEEALRCCAVGAVIGELRTQRGVGDVAVRRLSLAAAERGGLALLLRTAPSAEATPADTRWIVGPAASAPTRHGIGPPAIAVQLIRNRRGVLGSWMLEWNCVDQRFQLASTHPQPLAEAVVDRPRRAAGAA